MKEVWIVLLTVYSMTIVIQTKELTKKYPDALALDSLNISINEGDIYGLLGPNGAGKTTAIHMMLGLLSPTSGEVRVLGHDPIREGNILSSKINFSSAFVNLPSNLKISENLKIFSKLYGVKDYEKKVDELLNQFEIIHLKNRLVGALSSGEKTRLNLCKALLNDPAVLLLDEPTASLDPDVAEKVRRILKNIQKQRKLSIVYTSHNMNEVEALCDRVAFIHHGKKVAEGTPSEVKADHGAVTLEEVFIKLVRK